ncbi:MAG: hypothetical protein P8L21_03235, partial [Polaribacter sp.]|nr:hypothetical protein [Polaribacter sp.]
MIKNDTIIALATPSGIGAISVIRLSGEKSIDIVAAFFKSVRKGKSLNNQKSHTIHLGHIVSEETLLDEVLVSVFKNQKSHTIHLGHIVNDKTVLDEVLVSVFKNPKSYTGENVVEISCHGSKFIQQEIIQLFLKNGCRMADNGEFT